MISQCKEHRNCATSVICVEMVRSYKILQRIARLVNMLNVLQGRSIPPSMGLDSRSITRLGLVPWGHNPGITVQSPVRLGLASPGLQGRHKFLKYYQTGTDSQGFTRLGQIPNVLPDRDRFPRIYKTGTDSQYTTRPGPSSQGPQSWDNCPKSCQSRTGFPGIARLKQIPEVLSGWVWFPRICQAD